MNNQEIVTFLLPPDSIKTELKLLGTITTVLEIGQGVSGRGGDKGDKGDKGDAGAYLEYQQVLPMSTWTVAHNLNKHPSVTVTDNLGNVVVSDITYVDQNIVQIKHGMPLIGFVYCN